MLPHFQIALKHCHTLTVVASSGWPAADAATLYMMSWPCLQVILHDLRNLSRPLHTFENHNEEVFQVRTQPSQH